MNIFIVSLQVGLICFLTPVVFSMFTHNIFLFEKLANTKKGHKINTWLFGLIVVGIYIGLSQVISNNFIMELSKKKIVDFLITVPYLIFISYFLLTYVKKFEPFNKGILKTSFVILGITTSSFRLSVGALANIGPIITPIMASSPENTTNKLVSLLGFSIGLIIPFIILSYLVLKNYTKLKSKKWWVTIQMIIALYLTITTLVRIVNVFVLN